MKQQWMTSLAALAAAMTGVGILADPADEQARTSGSSNAQEQHEHTMMQPDEIPWESGPNSLPPEAEMAVLEGDPAGSGLLTVRFRFPDAYEIPPHWHPVDERVTVLEGKFGMGLGKELEKNAGSLFSAGSFVVVPKGARHFAWAEGETVIQLHGPAPLKINYLEPTDDPRNSQ